MVELDLSVLLARFSLPHQAFKSQLATEVLELEGITGSTEDRSDQ